MSTDLKKRFLILPLVALLAEGGVRNIGEVFLTV